MGRGDSVTWIVEARSGGSPEAPCSARRRVVGGAVDQGKHRWEKTTEFGGNSKGFMCDKTTVIYFTLKCCAPLIIL